MPKEGAVIGVSLFTTSDVSYWIYRVTSNLMGLTGGLE